MEAMDSSPVTAAQVKQWTASDPLLSISQGLRHGELGRNETPLSPYHMYELELSVYDGCVVHGNRVVIPATGRQRVIYLLH